MDVLDDKALRKKVQSVVEVQRQVYKEVLDKVQANGVKRRAVSYTHLTLPTTPYV